MTKELFKDIVRFFSDNENSFVKRAKHFFKVDISSILKEVKSFFFEDTENIKQDANGNSWKVYILLLIPIFCFVPILFPLGSIGFTSDFYSWIATYDEMGYEGFFSNFGDPGLHLVYHGCTFLLYKFFDIGPAWSIIFLAIHLLNSALLFSIFKDVLTHLKFPEAAGISFCSCLFFLVLPYQTEAVVWKACIHYLLCVTFCLLVFRQLFLVLKKQDFKETITIKWKAVLLISIWYLLAIYSLEIALMWPFVGAAFLFFFYLKKIPLKSFIKINTFYILPQFVAIVVYFIHQKILIGQWVGHYGAGTHLNLSPKLLASGLNHYLLKFFTFFRYLSFEGKRDVFIHSGQAPYIWMTMGLVVLFVLLVAYFVFFNKKTSRVKMGLFLCCGFIATIFPVLNLETTSLIDIQSDRYGYFASLFFCIGIAYVLFSLFKKYAVIPALLLCVLFAVLLKRTNNHWENAQIITNNLIDSYRWFDKENIYVTQLPDNYKGAYVFRNGFREAVEKHHHKKVKGEITRTVWYNWLETDECIESTPISTNPYQITATLDYGGKWWWWYGAGANSYEKENHRFDKDGQKYTMTFKDFNPETDIVIYPCKGKWEQVAFSN